MLEEEYHKPISNLNLGDDEEVEEDSELLDNRGAGEARWCCPSRAAKSSRSDKTRPDGALSRKTDDESAVEAPSILSRLARAPERRGSRGNIQKPVLHREALHGLLGRIVRNIDPQTEADPVAVAATILVFTGAVLGRTAHFMVNGARHNLNLFVVLVGRSSRGRKGTALSIVKTLFEAVESAFVESNVASGLSSGEGLVHKVRDPSRRRERGSKLVCDQGVSDKRVLITETEFASVLRVAARDGNTLSAVLRSAWDGDNLEVLTKNSAEKATSPHVSMTGHIVEDELRSRLDATEQANGFGNRIAWVAVERSKELPDAPKLNLLDLAEEIDELREAIVFGRDLGEMRRDEDASLFWAEIYSYLSGDRRGLFGALTARAEAQTMRFACLYAVLDQSPVIRRQHLEAALALWTYCDDSARLIFGRLLGDPLADRIAGELRRRPSGMTRTEINLALGKNYKKVQIDNALSLLDTAGLAKSEKRNGARGRPETIWSAVIPEVARDSDE